MEMSLNGKAGARMDPERRSLKAKLKASAWGMLAIMPPLDRVLTVRVGDSECQASVTVGPPGGEAEPETRDGGLFLSPMEAAIVGVLDHTTYLVGKQIAGKTSQRYAPRLKTLLNNLVDREILERSAASQGYRLSPRFRLKKKSLDVTH